MIGTVVSHYRVIDKLGAGGMGVVYRAEDLRLRRHVALKFLPDASITDPLAVERFEREARTASSLNHPNICTIHDVGDSDGRRFIVMELIDGTTLDRLIATGPIGIDRLIDIGIQVSDALDAAHAEGILHRDIKPGNIFLTKRDQVKVVDFGLAKIVGQRASTVTSITEAGPRFTTSAGIAVGTVAYMSPEHARGEPLDARSDLFSFGVVLYEMATGVQTFRGQTTAVIFDQILNRVPPAPSLVNPLIPPQLEQLVARSLEKDRRHRYQTARDLQSDLERLKRDLSTRRALNPNVVAESAISVGESWGAARAASGRTDSALLSSPGYPVPSPGVPPSGAYARPDSEDVERQRYLAKDQPRGPQTSDTINLGPDLRPDLENEPTLVVASPEPAAAGVAPTVPRTAASDPAGPTMVLPAPPLPVPPKTPLPAASGALAARRVAGQPMLPWAAAAAAVVVAVALAAWWLVRRPEVRVAASDPMALGGTAAAASPIPAAATAASPEPVATPAPPTATPPAPAATTPAPAVAPPTGVAPASPPPTGSRPTRAPDASKPAGSSATGSRRPIEATTAPAAAPAPAVTRAAEAAAALTSARELMGRAADEEALRAFDGIVTSFDGTPSAVEALALSAEIRLRRNDLAASTKAWVAYLGRSGDGERAGEGLIRTADAAARLKTRAGDELARSALHELLARVPFGVRAMRALQMKLALEDRLKLKQYDEQFGDTVPASVLTMREVATKGGATPAAEYALFRLANEYKERDRHELAAQTFVELATRFPNTRHEAWFAAAEIYDRQLKDKARARDAYLKVPASSQRYDDAQKRARRQ